MAISLRSAVFKHFQQLYEEVKVERPLIGDDMGSTISPVLCEHLTAEFSEDEVWNIIKTCDGNKAPGPDGFNMQSIKKGWSFMKPEIMAFFQEFHKNGKLPKV